VRLDSLLEIKPKCNGFFQSLKTY